jgi:sugar phosphate isomerase/epimerase
LREPRAREKILAVSDLGSRYAVCERVLRLGSFADDVSAASSLGVAGMGVDAQVLDATGAAEGRRILDGSGVVASSYVGLGPVFAAGGGLSPVTEIVRRLDVAAAVGAPSALLTTGALGRRDPVAADDECHDWIARVAPEAVSRGVTLMLEAVHPVLRRWSYVHTVVHALELLEGIPGTGVLVDLGHVFWERGLAATLRTHVDRIVSVQVTSLDAAALDAGTFARTPIYGGTVPVAELVGVLEDAGYAGWYEDETNLRSPRAQRIDMVRNARAWFEDLASHDEEQP